MWNKANAGFAVSCWIMGASLPPWNMLANSLSPRCKMSWAAPSDRRLCLLFAGTWSAPPDFLQLKDSTTMKVSERGSESNHKQNKQCRLLSKGFCLQHSIVSQMIDVTTTGLSTENLLTHLTCWMSYWAPITTLDSLKHTQWNPHCSVWTKLIMWPTKISFNDVYYIEQ